MTPMPQWELPHTKVEQAHRTVGLQYKDFHICVKNQELIFSAVSFVRDGLLATELALSAVNRHTSHHWHHTVLLLTLVHVEQNVECTSHFLIPFNYGCKTTVFWVIHRYAKCSSLRNKKRAVKGAVFCPDLRSQLRSFKTIRETISGLRFRNLTPSSILRILRYPHFRTSSFFPDLPLF